MSEGKNLPLLGFALEILMKSHGWTGARLAATLGVRASVISSYITEGLSRERLEELAVVMGLGPAEVERAVLAARLNLPPEPTPWSPVDPTDEERRIDVETAAMAGSETLDLVLELRLREHWTDNRRRDLEKGRELARELMTYSPAGRRLLIEEGGPDYQHWGLAFVLARESETLAPRNPTKALELAELALLVARHVQGTDGCRFRLEAWCTGFLGNVKRAIGRDLPDAGRDFDRVWHLWDQGEDPAGLFSKAYLLDMEASVRRDQRLFSRARRLHGEALKLAQPTERGTILLNKAFTLQHEGKPEKALQVLEEAAEHIDADRQPRLRCVLRYNQAANLILAGRADEAAPIVDEVRKLAVRLRNDTDLLKTLWLEGNCAAGLGQRDKALAALEQVLRELEVRGFAFDYALAGLDVALLYREEGRFGEIKLLADKMLAIFKAQKVDREAVAAVILFQQAAAEENITVELVRRLQQYFRANPQLHFAPPVQLPGVQPP